MITSTKLVYWPLILIYLKLTQIMARGIHDDDDDLYLNKKHSTLLIRSIYLIHRSMMSLITQLVDCSSMIDSQEALPNNDACFEQVKVFRTEDCPAKVASQPQRLNYPKQSPGKRQVPDLPPGFEGNHYADKLSVSTIPRIKWKRPRKVVTRSL